jgi:hypothetical protein
MSSHFQNVSPGLEGLRSETDRIVPFCAAVLNYDQRKFDNGLLPTKCLSIIISHNVNRDRPVTSPL